MGSTPITIESFRDDYFFLSNFAPVREHVYFDGVGYPSVEHAYQAAKTLNREQREEIRKAPRAGDAKKMGGPEGFNGFKITCRPDWELVRLGIMEGLIEQKFGVPAFRKKLLATGDAYLIEGNWWKDFYWGVCNGKGENNLGKLLMWARARNAEGDLPEREDCKKPDSLEMKPLTGNTYPVRQQLGKLGGRWNPFGKCWMIPADRWDEAKALVDEQPEHAFQNGSKWDRETT